MWVEGEVIEGFLRHVAGSGRSENPNWVDGAVTEIFATLSAPLIACGFRAPRPCPVFVLRKEATSHLTTSSGEQSVENGERISPLIEHLWWRPHVNT